VTESVCTMLYLPVSVCRYLAMKASQTLPNQPTPQQYA
jgi:hypothetical protein